MHLVLVARAEMRELERWKSDLAAIHFPYKVGNKDKFIQMGVMKTELLDLIFPEEHLEEIIRALQITDKMSIDWKDAPVVNKIINVVRKALKLKPIPKVDMSLKRRFINNRYIQKTAIGIKEDVKHGGREHI